MNILKAILNMPVSDRSDEETGELVKEWLRRYFPTIVSGVVIALLVVFAMNWWRDKERRNTLALSHQLEVLQEAVVSNNKEAAKEAYVGELAEDDSADAYLGALLIAKVYVDDADYEQAKIALEKASQAKDGLVVQTAQWQLANMYVSQKQYEPALKVLQGLKMSAFDGQAARLEGDVYYLQGKMDLALSAYEQSLTANPSPLTEILVKQLKTQINLQKTEAE